MRETFTNFGFIGSSIITASGRWYLVVSGEKLRESELAKEQEREREREREGSKGDLVSDQFVTSHSLACVRLVFITRLERDHRDATPLIYSAKMGLTYSLPRRSDHPQGSARRHVTNIWAELLRITRAR